MSWLIDGLTAIQYHKSKETNRKWIENFTLAITPPAVPDCILIDMVNYTY